MKDAVTYGPLSSRRAMYKGQAVTVYSIHMTDISLTRQDIVDLVEVSSRFVSLLILSLPFAVCSATILV